MLGPARGVQPVAYGPQAAQDGSECNPTQNGKFTDDIMSFFCVWLCVAVYLMCGQRQLFFFQCGLVTLKGWTPYITHGNVCAHTAKGMQQKQQSNVAHFTISISLSK